MGCHIAVVVDVGDNSELEPGAGGEGVRAEWAMTSALDGEGARLVWMLSMLIDGVDGVYRWDSSPMLVFVYYC